MSKRARNKRAYIRALYTIIAAILLVAVFFLMVTYVYEDAEENAFETLHMTTKDIKDELNIQMKSDRENLVTMANFASMIYKDGADFSLLFDSFEPMGLIEYIGILLPDNIYLTKDGKYDATGKLSFTADMLKGEYVSGLLKSVTLPERDLVRSAVPIVSDGETVAMLYGITELGSFNEKHGQSVEGVRVCVIDNEGKFVINTLDPSKSRIEDFKDANYKEPYSYVKMISDIMVKNSGYSAFNATGNEKYFYTHYAPLDMGNWQIMLFETEENVFAGALAVRKSLLIMFTLCTIIMTLYLSLIICEERRMLKIAGTASRARKLLLDINNQGESLSSALYEIALFAKSRSAFFVDTDGEDYNYIMPEYKNKLLKMGDREIFLREILDYMGVYQKGKSTMVIPKTIMKNRRLKNSSPTLYDFMEKHGFKRVCIATVSDRKDMISILGVINPGISIKISELLKEVAVCFTIAIKNKKYLHTTERVASTDALTGLFNRMTLRYDMEKINEKESSELICVYIDVNELHIHNHKYGHDAGDKMLLTVADAFRENFAGCRVYRIGGDEFLVFAENMSKEDVDAKVRKANEFIESKNYHVSVGVSLKNAGQTMEQVIKEAEKRMYEEKAVYYKNKGENVKFKEYQRGVDRMDTGIDEVDCLLTVMSKTYRGIYFVNTASDTAKRIIMPEYFKEFNDESGLFSKTFFNYVTGMVKSDYHRALLGLLHYDSWEKQRDFGEELFVDYEKMDGSKMTLNIHTVSKNETIWIFETER